MTASDRAIELARAAAAAASDKLAQNVVALDVSDHLVITDAFVVASGANQPQINAIKDAVQDALLQRGAKAVRREGEREGRWVLLDFSEIVVHIMHTDDRAFYALERLWSDCPVIATASV